MTAFIDTALSYFKDDNIPSAKTLTDEVWRPNYNRFSSDELKAISFLIDYAALSEKLGKLALNNIEDKVGHLAYDYSKVCHLINPVVTLTAFSEKYRQAKVLATERNNERLTQRQALVETKLMAVGDKLNHLQAQKTQINTLLAAYAADIEKLNDELATDGLSIQDFDAASGDRLIICDSKPDDFWQRRNYFYDAQNQQLEEAPVFEHDCRCDDDD